MAISLGSEEGSLVVGSEVLFQNGYSLRKAPLLTIGNATYLRSGRISVGDDLIYPEAYAKFGWPGQYWTPVSGVFSGNLSDTIFAFGKWYIGGTGGILKTSTDGITWTTYTSAVTATVTQFCLANNILAAATTSGIYTTTDGITWTQRTTLGVSNVAYGAGKWLAGSQNNTGVYYTSTDTITWTTNTVSGPIFRNSVVYGNNIWVTTGTAGAYYTSPDAITWTARSQAPDASATVAVGFGYGVFYMTTFGTSAGSPRFVYRSFDGINWGAAAALPSTIGYPSSVWTGNIKVDSKGAVYIPLTGYSAATAGVATSFDGYKFVNNITTLVATEQLSVVGISDSIVFAASQSGNLYYSRRSIGIPVEDITDSAIRYMRIK